MRDIVIVVAAICAVGGLSMSVGSILDGRSDSWRSGFAAGCLAMSVTALLGAVVAAWVM